MRNVGTTVHFLSLGTSDDMADLCGLSLTLSAQVLHIGGRNSHGPMGLLQK